MQTILVKRSAETMLCEFDCSLMLSVAETITSVQSIAHDANNLTSLTFGTPAVNSAPITYPDLRTVPAGKVVQVLIGAGAVGEYVIRCRFATSTAGELREATVQMLVNNDP